MESRSLYVLAIIILISCQKKTVINDQPEFDSRSIESPSKTSIEQNRPNVLWIVAEDLSEYLPSFGDSTIVTPNLSRLAAEGICYDKFFSPAAVCAPARSAIATGMYPTSIGTNHMRTGPWYAGPQSKEHIARYGEGMPPSIPPHEAVLPPEVKMMSQYLRMNGYFCTNNAKQDYQFVCPKTAWDQNNRKAHWRNRSEGQPFFSIFNLEVTHESRIWSKAKDSLWVANDLPVSIPPYLPDTEIGRKDFRRMYSNIKEMDHQVGKIIDQLEEDGLLEETIIVWYSDHGGPLPRQKRLLYDSGIKVPMIIRFPDKRGAGTRNDELVSFIDLAPTVMSLAGMSPPSYMDGKAFLGRYKRTIPAKYVHGAADRFDESYDTNRAVRDKRFKYIKYFEPELPMFLHVSYRDQQPIMQELYRLRDQGIMTEAQALWFREVKPEEELFDTTTDPHEIKNLAEDPKYKTKLIELRKECERWIAATNDKCIGPESALLAEYWPDGKQPKTDIPTVKFADGLLTIDCKTEGANLAYKVGDNESWHIYTNEVILDPDADIKVIAHRIGFEPSAEITVNRTLD